MKFKIDLQPKQHLFREALEHYPVTFYGGAKGGGKSAGLRRIFLGRRFKYPGSHGAIFRRTYGELEGNHIRPLFEEFPDLRVFWHEGKKLLNLPNGSTLQFLHCANEQDVTLYQGREFHDLGIDEAGQWTEAMFRTLYGSNRSSKPGIKPRTALTGNPGGIGHSWLKRLFVERRFNERERQQDYHFIQALVDDNDALLVNDPDYVHKLNTEPNEALRKAYRFGDWDIFAGQFFSEIRREVHLIKPIPIRDHWPRFGAYDFGFNHPAAFGWFASDEDGNVYQYREHIKAGRRVDQFCDDLLKFPETKKLEYIKAGWDCWAKRSQMIKGANPPTIAEEFLNHDMILSKAVIDRVTGATNLRSYLAWQGLASGRELPRFFIFDTCPITYDCLARMIHDPDHPEDVLKVDATEGDPMTGDDPYDMVRYGLMSRPFVAEPIRRFAVGSPEWSKQQEEMHEEALIEALKNERGPSDDEIWGDMQ